MAYKKYRSVLELKKRLKGSYELDCGHKVTFGHNLGNNIDCCSQCRKKRGYENNLHPLL